MCLLFSLFDRPVIDISNSSLQAIIVIMIMVEFVICEAGSYLTDHHIDFKVRLINAYEIYREVVGGSSESS